MRSFGLVSLLFFFLSAVEASPELSLDCAGRNDEGDEACRQPMKAVTTVDPGSYYMAKLPCPECTVQEFHGEGENRTYKLVHKDNDLVRRPPFPPDPANRIAKQLFNISLTRDHRTLLLNGKPIFPSLSTNPHPPEIFTAQVPPSFSRADLENTLACARKPCQIGDANCQCVESTISNVELDFDYYSKWLESHPETQTEKWEVVFDAIGGTNGPPKESGRVFGSDEQSVLRIIIQGKELDGERYPGEQDLQSASTLFDNNRGVEVLYEYELASVEFMERRSPVPRVAELGFWGKIRRFFGNDLVRENGHIVYFAEEWGGYGKEGSFRQGIGIVIHEWPWATIFQIAGFVVLGILGLWFAWWLFFAVKSQRELARWDGMDQVWARMRRDGGDEDAQLLAERYRDESFSDRPSGDEGYRDELGDRPPSYSDEIQTNKPLPNKPLPEKPLPAVPLIDA